MCAAVLPASGAPTDSRSRRLSDCASPAGRASARSAGTIGPDPPAGARRHPSSQCRQPLAAGPITAGRTVATARRLALPLGGRRSNEFGSQRCTRLNRRSVRRAQRVSARSSAEWIPAAPGHPGRAEPVPFDGRGHRLHRGLAALVHAMPAEPGGHLADRQRRGQSALRSVAVAASSSHRSSGLPVPRARSSRRRRCRRRTNRAPSTTISGINSSPARQPDLPDQRRDAGPEPRQTAVEELVPDAGPTDGHLFDDGTSVLSAPGRVGGPRQRDRAGQRRPGKRSRVERDPADAGEEHLDPGVRVRRWTP